MFKKKLTAYLLSASLVLSAGLGAVPTTAMAQDGAVQTQTTDRNADNIQENRCYINGDEIRAYDTEGTVYVVVDDLKAYGFQVKKSGKNVAVTWAGTGYYFDESFSPDTDDAAMTSKAVKVSSIRGNVGTKAVTLYAIDGNLCMKAEDLGIFGYTKYDSQKNIMNIYVTEAGYTQNENYRNITVDASQSAGKIKSLQGIHYDPGKEGSEKSKAYIDIGVDTVRTHDIDGTSGNGRGIIYNLVPGYFKTGVNEGVQDDGVKSPETIKVNDSIDLNAPESYDFTELDKVIDNILATGSEIYFRFGASQNDNNKFPTGDEWNKYLDDLSIMAKHFVMHYDFGWDDGYYNILDYFEIWNEPDLADFWPNTAEQYYEMYECIAKAVKEVEPTLPVGGPTLTTLNDDDGIEESFIKFVAQNNCPMDFYAYHFYPSNNCDPYDYSRWAYRLNTLLKKYGFGDVPMILSEFGTVLFNPNAFKMADSAEASYLSAALMYLQDTPVVKANIYNRLIFAADDGSVKISKTAYGYKAVSEMNETPLRLAATGGDKNGMAVLAGRNDSGNQMNILVSNYEIPTSQMLSNAESGNPMIKDNKLQIPNVANWSLPVARIMTYANNAGYNLTVKDIPYNTKNVVVEQYRLDSAKNLELVSTKKVPVNADKTITLSNALNTYCVDLLKIRPGDAKDPVKPAEVKYTVTYNANGGKNLSVSAQKVAAGATLKSMPTCKRAGYRFTGWYTAKTGGTKVTSTVKITKNMTLYAHWSKVTVKRATVRSIKAGKRQLKVTYSKISGVSGYQIRYAKKSSMKSAKTLNLSAKKTSAVIKKLSAKKTYYVQVRAYKKDSLGKKVYGKWSKTAKKKTK